MRCTACSGGLHAADVSHVAKELVEEQPEEYTGEEDAEPYFYPSWERDGLKLWPVLVRPVALLLLRIRCGSTTWADHPLSQVYCCNTAFVEALSLQSRVPTALLT